MSTLTLENFCLYYASRCSHCNGQKRILNNGVWYECQCQILANTKWKLERLRVYPDYLKQLTWSDFTGVIKQNDVQTGMLTVESAIKSKQQALEYCYKNGDNSSASNLILHRRASSGSNLIISGGKSSGKTLLGVLVIKEVLKTCVVNNLSMSFDWVSSSEVKEYSRWDNTKAINHSKISELSDVDFLVIDDVDIEVESIGKTYNHSLPPDRVCLNSLFRSRNMFRHPTLLLCSDRLVQWTDSPLHIDSVSQQWGTEFVNMLTNKSNVIIKLEKAN